MSQPTILFLGATGGVTNAVLSHTLKSGTHHAVALVRTPSKLTTQLQTQQGLGDAELSNLTIIQGNALNQDDLRKALLANNNTLPSLIMSGLGAAPVITFDIRHPLQIFKIDQPTLCGDAAKALVSTLHNLYLETPALESQKPHVVFVSTTGITRGPEDVPWGMRTLYHVVLAVPHEDKRNMENAFRAEVERGTGQGVFATVTGIRPTLLKGTGVLGRGAGVEKVRAGVESKPETGFTISRTDVGSWVWEHVVRVDKQMEKGKGWRGEMVSLAV